MRSIRTLLLATVLSACSSTPASAGTEKASPPPKGDVAVAFSGGCFWCMEAAFDGVPGVVSATSGYTGGKIEGPTYEQVSSHQTQHRESVRVVFDPKKISYAKLLDIYWHNVDPTQSNGQFCDHGHQYTSAIWVSTPEERALAEKTKAEAQKDLGQPVVTVIRDAQLFWVAEAYHQDYHDTHPVQYHRYHTGCGRDARLKQLWGDKAGGGPTD